MRRRALAGALTGLLLAAACGGKGEVSVEHADEPDQGPDSVYVHIINNHFYDARIHAKYDRGQSYSLGTVVGSDEQGRSTAIAWSPQPLVFEVLLIVASERYVSYEINLERGDVVQLTIPPNIGSAGTFRRVQD
jgi:hypothetical protein